MRSIRDWGFIEWFGVVAIIVFLVFGTYIAVQLPGCLKGCAEVIGEVTEDVSPQECKQQCEAAGADTWAVKDGNCECSGKAIK